MNDCQQNLMAQCLNVQLEIAGDLYFYTQGQSLRGKESKKREREEASGELRAKFCSTNPSRDHGHMSTYHSACNLQPA